MRVAVMLGEGFEPLEAVATIDVVRRGNVEVHTVSVGAHKEVTASHSIPIVADASIDEVDLSDYDLIMLPGGMPGVTNLATCQKLARALTDAAAQDRYIAAICAAPHILADLGLLEGHEATCYPGFETGFPEGVYRPDKAVCVSGKLITANGPGAAVEFGLAILALLCGDEAAQAVASGMQIKADTN